MLVDHQATLGSLQHLLIVQHTIQLDTTSLEITDKGRLGVEDDVISTVKEVVLCAKIDGLVSECNSPRQAHH
jgi:hypothetical protein